MSRILPRSLPAWLLIVVITALVISQVLTLGMASYFASGSNRTADLFRLVERTSSIVRAVSAVPEGSRADLVRGLNSPSLRATLDKDPAVKAVVAPDDELAELEDVLLAKLESLGATDLRVAEHRKQAHQDASDEVQPAAPDAGSVEEVLSEMSDSFASTGQFVVSVQLADGAWLNIHAALSPAPTLLKSNNFYWYALFSALTILLCFWAVHQLVAPYRFLQNSIEQLGDNLNSKAIAEQGSGEVRKAIRAINRMQAKLRDYVAEKESMSAALAHDLRTPLTHMKLRSELYLTGKARKMLLNDLQELERIIESVLEFAHAGTSKAPREQIDLPSLAESVCDQFKAVDVSFTDEASGPLVVTGHATALRRCIGNLAENAIKHGGKAHVSVRAAQGHAVVDVEDDGPGMPEAELENVLKPYYRVESSRNRKTGGIGLGLAIANAIAKGHDGTLALSNRPEGGIRARLSIPLPSGPAAGRG